MLLRSSHFMLLSLVCRRNQDKRQPDACCEYCHSHLSFRPRMSHIAFFVSWFSSLPSTSAFWVAVLCFSRAYRLCLSCQQQMDSLLRQRLTALLQVGYCFLLSFAWFLSLSLCLSLSLSLTHTHTHTHTHSLSATIDSAPPGWLLLSSAFCFLVLLLPQFFHPSPSFSFQLAFVLMLFLFFFLSIQVP